MRNIKNWLINNPVRIGSDMDMWPDANVFITCVLDAARLKIKEQLKMVLLPDPENEDICKRAILELEELIEKFKE